MMFGGAPMAGNGSGGGPNSPQRRLFKRGGGQSLQPHMQAMHMTPAQQQMMVNGLSVCAAPSQARFFSYSEFVQAKSPTAGDGESKSDEREKKKKKKSKN